ncbi:MAG: response regulator [Gemmatimonadales bacterium]|nr:response regulator [Gemmatimonadales bacterium]
MNGAVSPTPARATALRVALALLAIHGLAFSISELSAVYADKGPLRRLYEAGSFLPLQLASMLALLAAARRATLPRETRAGLRFLAAAFGALVLGSVAWLVMEARGTPLMYISWADLIFFQFYPLLILGFWSLPIVEQPADRLRDSLGVVVLVIVFGSLIAYAANVEAQTRVYSTALRLMTTATAAAQLATLMLLNRVMERGRRIPSPAAILWLAGALAVSVVVDLVFQVLFSAGYTGRNWSVVSSVVANLMVVYAAIRFLEDRAPESESAERPRIPFSPLPIISVSALALVLVWMAGQGQASGTGTLLVGLVVVNAMLVVREILASRASAEALRSSAERDATRRVEALVRHASDAILLMDGEGRLVFASAPADRLFGAPMAAYEGASIADVLPEQNREPWREFVAELLTSGERPVTFNLRFERADGSSRMIECVGLDLRDEPAVRGLVVHSRDITDRALLEDRLRQSQKLEVAGRLAGGVAHDFNNVLTAVIAGTELAQMSLEPGHAAHQDLVGVEAAAQRGAALTRRLLAFVRQEPVPAQRVDVRRMLEDIEPLLQRLAGDANTVVCERDGELGTVFVDLTELEHIVFNLVANARDAMPMGGEIIVRASMELLEAAPAGSVIAPPPGRHVCIAVVDQGHGMAEDVRRRMFDPFFTQKSGGRGTGLGLIGVRPLVEGAKGGLVVDSSVDRGTRVALYLPAELEGAPVAPARRSSPTRTPAFGTPLDSAGRILLVEDELPVREQLIRLIDVLGYSSIAVPSAADARAVLAAEAASVDAVITDVMMPGETGVEFATWLRREHPGLPILLISGHTGAALDREARATEGFDLLRKPFTSAELSERIKAMLDPYRPDESVVS